MKRGEIGKQSWLYAMPAFYFCAIFAAVERFFRAYIPGPVSDVLSKIQLFLPLLAFVSLWCAQVWGLKRGYIEQKYRKTVTVGVTLLPIMTLIFILLFSMLSSKIGGVSMTERFDYTISLSKPARRRKYKVQNAVLCGGVFCA